MENKEKKWTSRTSLFFYGCNVLLILSWFVFPLFKTLRVISLVLFSIAYFLFIVKDQDKKLPFPIRLIIWIGFIMLLILDITFIAISVDEVGVAVLALLSVFVIIAFAAILINFINLLKTKRLIGIMVSYVIVSFLFIAFFGVIYTFSSSYEGNDLIWSSSGNRVDYSAWDYIYFSSNAYYANSVGDIHPIGLNKFLMQVESALSFLFHLIIIAYVISNLRKKKIYENDRKL